jgi:hypothetical protein
MKTWKINAPSVPKLLAAVAQFLPEADTVAFEISNPCPEAQELYTRHLSSSKFRPDQDTHFPETSLYYCKISKSLADDLEGVLHDQEIKNVFWHIKGFDDRRMLFSIHDADMGDPAYFSGRIEDEIISRLATALEQTPVQIETSYNWGKKWN